MRRVFGVAALCVATSALGQSQPPTPRKGGQRAEQQQAARQIQNQTPVNQSVAAPQSAPIAPVAPPSQITIHQANGDEDGSSDAGLRDWIVGLLTIGVGILQWWVMHQQRKVSTEQAAITERQNTIINTQTGHMEAGLTVARDSAKAAQDSADAALDGVTLARKQLAFAIAEKRNTDRQLRLAFQPFVDVSPSWFTRVGIIGTDPVDFRLTMQISNPMPVLARIERVDTQHRVQGRPGFEFASKAGFTLPTGGKETITIEVEIPETEVVEVFEQNNLVVETVVMVELKHPIAGPIWHTYHHTINCMGGVQPRVISRRDYGGRPEDQGQSQN